MGSVLPPSMVADSTTSTQTSQRRSHSNSEREIKHLRDLLQCERKRADEAEARTREALSHLKVINEARIKALQEAAQAAEELKLYKIQFETAQKEIYRAQDVLQVVDRQRLNAEKEAADLRSKNRRLLEEAKIQSAREQGRIQGMKEGMEKGRDLGLLEGRFMGYPCRTPPPLSRYEDDGSSVSSFADSRPRSRTANPPRPPSRTDSLAHSMNSRRSVDPAPVPIPPPSVSRRSSTQHLGRGSQATSHSMENTRPVSVRNGAPSPMPAAHVPPDNYIPYVDADNIIRLPPPHDFQRPSSRTGRSTTPPHDSETEERQHRRSNGTSYRRARRHSSPESDSTTLSQLDLVNDPNRDQGMTTPMSAIPEVSSSQTSPDPQPSRVEQDLRRQSSFAGSMRSQRSSASVMAPQSDSADLRIPIYTRPRTTSGSTISMAPPSQAMQHQPSQSTLGSGPDIAVEPPSSPSSTGTARTRHQQFGTSSANLQPSPLPVEPPNFSTSTPPPEQGDFPSPVVLQSSQLPPNFVPMSYTPAPTHKQLDQEVNTSGDGPPVIPDSALFGTDSSEDSEGASSVDTLTTPPGKQRHLDHGHQSTGPHYSASQAPSTPRWGDSTASGAAQVPIPPSTAPGTQTSSWGPAGVPLPPSTAAGTPWAGSTNVGHEDEPSASANTPSWRGSAVGKTPSAKSRSVRTSKRSIS